MALNFESGFPLYVGPATLSPAGTTCPFSLETMSEYLQSNHYHLALDEKPTTFENFELRETLRFQSRVFWVWSCQDNFKRIWDVVVGSGETPVHQQSGTANWMHATLYHERYSPREIVFDDYPEHANEIGKLN